MALPPIVMQMLLKDDKFKASLSASKANVDKFKKSWDANKGSIDKVSKSMAGLKAAIGAAVAAFAVAEIVQAANKQEAAVNAMNTALRTAGDYSDAASKDMQDFASNLQKVTTFGDETTLQMIALAKSFGTSNQQAKELVAAAAELSAATGMSLDSAVKNLGKSLAGMTGELGESLPALRSLTVEQLKAGAAIKLVADRFGGSAAAAAKTFGGVLEQVKNNFGDTTEELGFFITKNDGVREAMVTVRDVLADLNGWISDHREEINDVAGAIASFTARELRTLGVSFSSLAGIIDRQVLGAMRALRGETEETGDAFQDHLGVIGHVARGMLLIEQGFIKANAASVNLVRWGIAPLLESLRSLPGGEGLLGSISDDVREMADGAMASLQAQLVENAKALREIETPADLADKALQKVTEEYEKAELAARGAARAAKGFGDALEKTPKFKVDDDWWRKGVPQEGDPNFEGPIRPRVEGLPAGAFDFQYINPQIMSLIDNVSNALLSSIGQNLMGGRQGAASVLGAGAGAAVDTFIPGAGQFLGPMVTELAQASKEGAREMAEEFAAGITDGIKAFIENAPIFIEALAENSGEIITAIIAAGPKITAAWIKMQPQIAKALIKEFVDGVKYQIQNLGPGFAEAGQGFRETMEQAGEDFVDFFKYELPEAFRKGLDEFIRGFHHVSQQFFNNMLAIPDAIGRQLPAVILKTFTDAGNSIREAGMIFQNYASEAGGQVAAFFKEDVANAFSETWKAFLENFAKGGAFIKSVGDSFAEAAKTFIKTLVDKAQSVVDALSPGKKDGKKSTGGFEEVTGIDVPGVAFSTGGFVRGTGNRDTVPAWYTPGEVVVDRTTGPKLVDFLNSRDKWDRQSANDPAVPALLAKILEKLDTPITVHTSIEWQKRVLADMNLSLSRTNARVA